MDSLNLSALIFKTNRRRISTTDKLQSMLIQVTTREAK